MERVTSFAPRLDILKTPHTRAVRQTIVSTRFNADFLKTLPC
jgi:hypothetical protein